MTPFTMTPFRPPRYALALLLGAAMLPAWAESLASSASSAGSAEGSA